MYNTSILKEIDRNTPSLLPENSRIEGGFTGVEEVRLQFKAMQIKILNIFTLAKSELTACYQQIVSKVKKIQKCLYSECPKVIPTFTNMLRQIEAEIQQKMQSTGTNITNTVIAPFLFDQLLSLMADSCLNEAGMSQKKINNSSIASKTMNQTVADLNNISSHEYKWALKIKPTQKGGCNLGCLSGQWDALEEINLENRRISVMIPLSTVIAETLQEINLSHNQIHQLDFVRGAQYPILRLLNLRKNAISNLDGLQEGVFRNLKILNLSQNRLKSLDSLAECTFQQLVELNISSNRIQAAQPLIPCNFPKLEVLNLDHNSIRSLEFILSCSFYRLKILSFCFNELSTIDCLSKCKLQRLQALLGYNNKIASIDFLQFCDWPSLKELILSNNINKYIDNNLIQDIRVVERLKFPKLTEFDLENNKVKPQEVMCFVTNSDQCRKARKKYPFIQL